MHIRDITEQQKTLLAAAQSEYWKNSRDLLFIKNLDGIYVAASQSFADMLNLDSPDEIIGKNDFEVFLDYEIITRYINDDARLLAEGRTLENYVEPFENLNGRPRYCLTSKYLLRNAAGAAIGIFGTSRDITTEYLAKKNYESELRNLFKLPSDALIAILFDITSWHIVDSRYKDDARHIVSSYSTIDEYVKTVSDSIVNNDQETRAFFAAFNRQQLQQIYDSGKRNFAFEYLRRLSIGSEHWVRNEFHFLVDSINGNLLLFVTLRDIDDSKREYSELVRAAQTDMMTGLLNRSTMLKHIHEYFQGEGNRELHALFIIDLDNFKQINDSFGHQYGDSILISTAKSIRQFFRATDIVGRLGGDEFMALMKNVRTEKSVRSKAHDLIAALQISCRNNETTLELSSSIGIVIFRAGASDFNSLYNEADAALYKAKSSGKNRYCISGTDMQDIDIADTKTQDLQSVETVHLQTLMEYMAGGVILAEVTDDIRITYISPSFNKSFGCTAEDLEENRNRIFDFIHPDDQQPLRTALFKTAHSDTLLDFSCRIITKAGPVTWINIRSKCLPDNNNSSKQQLVSIITDISQLKQTEERLLKMEDRSLSQR